MWNSNKLTLHWTNTNLVSWVLRWWKQSRPANNPQRPGIWYYGEVSIDLSIFLATVNASHLLQSAPNCLPLILADRHVNVGVHDTGSADGGKEAWLSPCSLREAFYGNKAPNLNSQNANWTLQTIIQIHSYSWYSHKICSFLSPPFAPLSPWPMLPPTALCHKSWADSKDTRNISGTQVSGWLLDIGSRS